MHANRRNFCVLEEIGVEQHDNDVRFKTGSGNRSFFACAMKKYAIQPLFIAESKKFPRLKEIGVEEHDDYDDVKF